MPYNSVGLNVADADVLEIKKEGLVVCSECHSAFDPTTKKSSEKYKGVFFVRPIDQSIICHRCLDSIKWPTR